MKNMFLSDLVFHKSDWVCLYLPSQKRLELKQPLKK